jgi:hypothetical protein
VIGRQPENSKTSTMENTNPNITPEGNFKLTYLPYQPDSEPHALLEEAIQYLFDCCGCLWLRLFLFNSFSVLYPTANDYYRQQTFNQRLSLDKLFFFAA